MVAYVVKHLSKEQGSLKKIIKELNGQPHSYTNKRKEAITAAQENEIYVIEVTYEKREPVYWLGYRFTSTKCEYNSKLWNGAWKYKNSVTYVYTKPVIGCYFEDPIFIHSKNINEWLRTLGRSGMTSIPEHLIVELERIILNPVNKTQQF